MDNEFTTIEPLINHTKVIKTIDEVKNDYATKINLDNNESSDQKKVEHVLSSLSTYYQNMFNNAYNEAIDFLKLIPQNESNTLNSEVQNMYKRLKYFNYNGDLSQEPLLNLKKVPHNHKYLYQTNNFIRHYLQKLYVEPLVIYIENNYLQEILNINLLPIHVDNIIEEIKDDNIVFYESDCETIKEDYLFLFSNKSNCLYYFSYCNYNDIYSYHSHLENVLAKFKQSVNISCSSIDNLNLKLEYLNRIRAVIKEHANLFQKTHSLKLNKLNELTFHIRKITLTIFQQLTIELFGDEEFTKVRTYFLNFQDMQYQLAIQALSHIESKIKMLRFVIKHKLKIRTTDDESNNLQLNGKLDTNLTVPQLGFLLRSIVHEKSILNIKSNADLFRKVVLAITSLEQDNISVISLKNNFTIPAESAIEFCIEIFTHLLQFAKQERDRIRR